MIEWLSSKIGVLIAIGVLTTFVLGLFAWQHSMMVDREGQGVADSISRALDSVGGLQASTVLNISFGSGSGELPVSINGKAYSINITERLVMVNCDGRLWISELTCPVLPGNLESRAFNLTEYAEADFPGATGEHPSGQSFRIERAPIDVSGERIYLTLVYWE